jgi:hypothetical protein
LTSERKIRANRVNARASTGPQTHQGRARAARNALRHALTLPVYSDPLLSKEVETLAREIAGPDANEEAKELARRVADAQIDLRRVRYARHQLLLRALSDPLCESQAKWARFRRLRNGAPNAPIAELLEHATTMPERPQRLANILLEQVRQLSGMDRYERRALSRRKFAIRAFDLARRTQNDCRNGIPNCR